MSPERSLLRTLAKGAPSCPVMFSLSTFLSTFSNRWDIALFIVLSQLTPCNVSSLRAGMIYPITPCYNSVSWIILACWKYSSHFYYFNELTGWLNKWMMLSTWKWPLLSHSVSCSHAGVGHKTSLPFFLWKIHTFYLYFSLVTLDSAGLFCNCFPPSTHMYLDISLLVLEIRTEGPLLNSMWLFGT